MLALLNIFHQFSIKIHNGVDLIKQFFILHMELFFPTLFAYSKRALYAVERV